MPAYVRAGSRVWALNSLSSFVRNKFAYLKIFPYICLVTILKHKTMNTLRPNQVIAPKKYGNPYFDAMSIPVALLPETFTVGVKIYNESGDSKDTFTGNPCTVFTAVLKTADHYVQGNFVARRYTGCNMHKPELHKAAYLAIQEQVEAMREAGTLTVNHKGLKGYGWPKMLGLIFRNDNGLGYSDGIDVIKPKY